MSQQSTTQSQCDLFLIHKLADGSWRLEYRTETSVHPTIDYPNAKRLLARMAQLLDTGPFNPQLHPERIGIE